MSLFECDYIAGTSVANKFRYVEALVLKRQIERRCIDNKNWGVEGGRRMDNPRRWTDKGFGVAGEINIPKISAKIACVIDDSRVFGLR